MTNDDEGPAGQNTLLRDEAAAFERDATSCHAISRTEINDAAGMAMAVGLAGYQYGSPAVHVQLFVESAFQTFLKDQSASGGASGTALVACCRLTQSECFLSVERADGRGNQSCDDLDGPIVFMKPATNGCHMAKLSSLSVLAERLLRSTTQQPAHDTSSSEASTRMDEDSVAIPFLGTNDGGLIVATERELTKIDTSPNPWGTISNLFAWLAIGLALPPVFGATWRDVILGGSMAVLAFFITYAIDNGARAAPSMRRSIAKRLAPWECLLQAYIASLVASLCQAYWNNTINPTKVTLGAIAVPLPGYAISVGVIELAADNITGGFSHIVKGLLTLLLLVVGAALGIATGNAISEPAPLDNVPPYFLSDLWQILWLPLLCVGLAVALQNSPRDFPWSVLCQGFTYAVSYGGAAWVPGRPNIGYFFGGAALSIASSVWGNIVRRSPLPLAIPSFVLSISGSIGFRGMLNISEGNTSLGGEQFWQMFVVAGVTMAGLVAGNFVVRPTNAL